MKIESQILDHLQLVIPSSASKIAVFAAITSSSYEVYYYAKVNGKFIQCYDPDNHFDENDLDDAFAAVVKTLKTSNLYESNKLNVFTITIEGKSVSVDVDYHSRDEHWYKIQKEWKENNLR